MNKSKYSEDLIFNKKLPVFYDYYDSKCFDNVYEPSDDTFLLTDCLGLEGEHIASMSDIISVEVGVGSGYVSAYFVDKYRDRIKKHYCVDINNDALDLTKRIIDKMDFSNVEVMKSNLFENISEKFDIIIFNPV
jgi:methylase of polypeptide subunit release factors